MSSTSETPIEYRSYSIQKDQRNPYGPAEFMYYPTEQGVEHDADFDGEQYKYTGNCAWASTIEEAKSEIDERIAEQESKNPNPYKDQIIKLELRKTAIQNAINNFLLLSGYDETTAQLIEMRDEIAQQINDLQVDANTLPFPQK